MQRTAVGVEPRRLLQAVLDDLSKHEFVSNEQAYAGNVIVNTLLKKFEYSSDETRAKALDNFIVTNASIEDFSVPRDAVIRSVLESAKAWFLQYFPQNEYYAPDPSNGVFGPGKSHGVEAIDAYAKMATSMTYSTAPALSFYLDAASLSPVLWAGETIRRRSHGYTKQVASRLTTVPKNDVTDRTICIEPSLQMFLQQAIRKDLEAILYKNGISLKTQQEVHKDLARRASVADSLSTIDLSMASDTIGYSFAKWLLPQDLFSWLDQARSKWFEHEGEVVELRMLSSMGNATTFPIQTMIFLALARGCYKHYGIKIRPFGSDRNIGVFGDDIIVVPEVYDLLCSTLNSCGFTVNLEKSFKSGLFKESCGGDYYAGCDVRGVYIRRLARPQDVFSAVNRLNRWSVKTGIPLKGAVRILLDSLHKYNLVPEWEQDDSGVQTNAGFGAYVCYRAKGAKVSYDNYNVGIASALVCGGYATSCSDDSLVIATRGDVGYRKRNKFALSWQSLPRSVAISENALLKAPRIFARSGWSYFPLDHKAPYSVEWESARRERGYYPS